MALYPPLPSSFEMQTPDLNARRGEREGIPPGVHSLLRSFLTWEPQLYPFKEEGGGRKLGFLSRFFAHSRWTKKIFAYSTPPKSGSRLKLAPLACLK